MFVLKLLCSLAYFEMKIIRLTRFMVGTVRLKMFDYRELLIHSVRYVPELNRFCFIYKYV